MVLFPRYGSVTLKDNSVASLADNKYHSVWIRRPSRSEQVSQASGLRSIFNFCQQPWQTKSKHDLGFLPWYFLDQKTNQVVGVFFIELL